MGRASAYKKFRELRYKTDDVFQIIQGLDTYSELGKEYVKQLEKVIRYSYSLPPSLLLQILKLHKKVKLLWVGLKTP